MKKKIIITKEQYKKIFQKNLNEGGDFNYLDDGDTQGNYKEYPESEVADVGKVGDFYGKSNITTDKYVKSLAKQDWWWSSLSGYGSGIVQNNLPLNNIKEESDEEENKILDFGSGIENKLNTLLPLINTKNKQYRFAIINHILKTINTSDFDYSLKTQIRDLIFSN